MDWLVACLTILAAYLIGAIPFGYLVARSRGINIFEHGSGNIGATNVGRTLGRTFGVLVFLLDFAKGAVPVALAMMLKTRFDGEFWSRGFIEVGAGLAAFLGHLFPVYLKFHGGKGVATGAGAVAVLMPIPALASVGAWLIVVWASRFVSLASIVAVAVLCAVQLRQTWGDWLEPRSLFCLVAGGLVAYRHRANIGRLLNGTENQLKENVFMHQLGKTFHVLALGLWFGSSVFFTFVVALSLFHTFETAAEEANRPSWLPRPAMYSGTEDNVNGLKEQGTRVAGYAVGPIFLWYFALQGACGFLALATALPWMKFGGIHRWRVHLLLVAVALVLIGWPLERHVSALRLPRNETMEAYLQDRTNDAKRTAMQQARAEFGQWHGVSVLLNLATILVVTGAMALAGSLPMTEPKVEKPSSF